MRPHSHRAVTLAIFAFACLLLPSAAAAQSTIAGLVTDTSGAVLPGVTVEAASPALIEKVRTAVTNADGRYNIVDIRPGVYAVTFTLPGFGTQTRRHRGSCERQRPGQWRVEGGRRGGNHHRVGVATPVVDIQQAALRQVLSRETLDALPSARSISRPAAHVQRQGVEVRHGRHQSGRARTSAPGERARWSDVVQIDGLDFGNSNGTSQSGYNNFAMVQDVTYQTSAIGGRCFRWRCAHQHDSAGGRQ